MPDFMRISASLKPRCGYRSGQTLIEVTIATLIAAMMTVGIFSIVLSSFITQKRADKREAATMAMQSAQEELKNYVTAVPTLDYNPGGPGGHWAADTNPGWALNAGAHDITSLLATSPLNDGTGPVTFTYNVLVTNCGEGSIPIITNPELGCREVTFTLTYPD